MRKKDRIGLSCEIAIDSINAARDYLSQAIANLRYAANNPNSDTEHMRSNSLSSATIDLDRAAARIDALKEFTEALREQHWDNIELAAAPIFEAFCTEDDELTPPCGTNHPERPCPNDAH